MTVDQNCTEEQRRIVDLPLEAQVVVEAPAGTGKTHVLAARLSRLIDRDALSSGDEALVLSFSRAVVAELRDRTAAMGGDARYVGVETFDSFATRLLASEDPEGSWTTAGYDGRIVAATSLLERCPTPPSLTGIMHILVDEIQDLVGARAAMVRALLVGLDVGFTLFGDSAQAIYGYQAKTATYAPVGDSLAPFLENTRERTVLRMALTRDFRSMTREADAIAAIGNQLRSMEPDQTCIAHKLRSVSLKLDVATLRSARRTLVRSDGLRSAFLCRTNAEALRISGLLFEQDIPHSLRRRSEDRAASGWLSVATLAVPETRTTRAALMQRLELVDNAFGLSALDMFRVVRRLDPQRGDGVDLRRVANRLRLGDSPEELNATPDAGVVVSTIHRAKGLEFDRVFVCARKEHADDDEAEENRISYVAMTRARRELLSFQRPDTTGLVSDPRTRRCVRRGFGRNSWRLFELELVGSDSDAIHPAGSWLYEQNPRAVQEYIVSQVRAGDPLSLMLGRKRTSGGANLPHYIIRHGGQAVGVTSDTFGADLRRLLGPRGRAPDRIEGVHVEMIDTVAGDPITATRNSLGAHGLWARVRVFGLGAMLFDDQPRKD